MMKLLHLSNVDFLGEPIVIPEFRFPVAEPLKLPMPTLELPRGTVPSYKPLVVPPSDLRPPPGVNPPNSTEEGNTGSPSPRSEPSKPTVPQTPSEIRMFEVPWTDYEVPVPSSEILVTAVSTATVSVAATLTATAIFKRLVSLMKPIIKQAWSRLTKKKEEKKEASLKN